MKIIDDGEYLTIKGRFHKQNGGKYRISVKKGTLLAKEFLSMHHAKTPLKGAT